MLLQACLNGDRYPGAHAALPVTPEQLARDAERAVMAGAGALHVHPRDGDGRESLAAEHVHAALRAIRAVVPGTPVGVSTGAWIEPDVQRQVAAICGWAGADAPDFASVNLFEQGADEVRAALLGIGVGIEGGLRDAADASRVEPEGLVRILIEPVEEDGAAAWATAQATAERLAIEAPLLAHGSGLATWTVVDQAAACGWDVRIGLEDTLQLADGRLAAGNAELVERVAVVVD